MDILQKITEHKRKETAEKKSLYPVSLLEKSIYFKTPVVSLKKYLLREDKAGIIAEFKRKSPSKGFINQYADVEQVSIGYMQAGASAISVLTDAHFFGGKNEDLTTVRKYNFCPVLRKDFIVDEYQIVEARSIGADAILLIAEILTAEEIKRFAGFAKSLGLEVLLETHSANHLEKLDDAVDVVGVNNRDLNTFEVSIQTSLDILPQIPNRFVKISESGLSLPSEVAMLKKAGFQGFLMGEAFMATADPKKACLKFIKELNRLTETQNA